MKLLPSLYQLLLPSPALSYTLVVIPLITSTLGDDTLPIQFEAMLYQGTEEDPMNWSSQEVGVA